MVSTNSHFTTLEALLERECIQDSNGQYNYNEVFGCSFMQWKRKYLSYDPSHGWSLVQLNVIDRIFRYLFGSHPTTHLMFIAKHMADMKARITNDNQMEAQFLNRMHRCWTQTHPTSHSIDSPFMYCIAHPSSTMEENPLTPLTDQSNQTSSELPIAQRIHTDLTTEKEIRRLIRLDLTDEDIQELMQKSFYSKDEIQQLIDQHRSPTPDLNEEPYDLISELFQDGLSEDEIIVLMQGSGISSTDIHACIERTKTAYPTPTYRSQF